MLRQLHMETYEARKLTCILNFIMHVKLFHSAIRMLQAMATAAWREWLRQGHWGYSCCQEMHSKVATYSLKGSVLEQCSHHTHAHTHAQASSSSQTVSPGSPPPSPSTPRSVTCVEPTSAAGWCTWEGPQTPPHPSVSSQTSRLFNSWPPLVMGVSSNPTRYTLLAQSSIT